MKARVFHKPIMFLWCMQITGFSKVVWEFLGFILMDRIIRENDVSAFLVFIRNRLISGVLEPVLIHTKIISCIVLYRVFYEYRMYNHNFKASIFITCLRHLGVKKTGINLIIVHLYPREAVYNTMQCKK